MLALFLFVVHSLDILCVAQQTCLAGEEFEKECACIPDVAAMFEGWFGRRTSAYCSQQFPEVYAHMIRTILAAVCLSVHRASQWPVLQVWTDFVDCFVDSVLAKGVTVPARYSPQVSLVCSGALW